MAIPGKYDAKLAGLRYESGGNYVKIVSDFILIRFVVFRNRLKDRAVR